MDKTTTKISGNKTTKSFIAKPTMMNFRVVPKDTKVKNTYSQI